MGNSQSTAEKEATAANDESQADARLRRFHTGASDVAASMTLSPSPSLRRTSTTATSSASENRHASLGRVPGAQARAAGAGLIGAGRRQSGTVSATGSPRASEREKAWVKSALRSSSTAAPGESTTSASRTRSRSGSYGNMLSGSRSRGATLHEDQVFDPQQNRQGTQASAARRAELTFRRKRSIDLSDVVDPPALTRRDVAQSGPSRPFAMQARQASQDQASLASPPSSATDTMRATDTASHLKQAETDVDRQGGPADVHNPLFPKHRGSAGGRDPLGRSQPAAFPSYLKIPTLIPSTYASPTSSLSSSPTASEMRNWTAEELSGANATLSGYPAKLGAGATTAAAILNTEDIVIKPGGASKASTPTEEKSPELYDETVAGAVEIQGGERPSAGEEGETVEGGTTSNPSRTPTPTPGNLRGARAMTPTGQQPTAMSSLSPAASTPSTVATERQFDAAIAPKAEQTDLPGMLKRAGVQVYTGTESGPNTPGLPGLPVGLTSAPSSALTPHSIPTYSAEQQSSTPSTPLTKATNNLHVALPPAKGDPARVASQARGTSVTPTRSQTASQVPMMPIVVKWRGGGKEVFVTGTFANEWRSKILLKKTGGTGRKAEYSCVLHLAPGTHRLKFIVDDRWRVSRDLSTASDGEGNLTNYIEVAHTGPAHPGPLSAPGEDLPVGAEEEKEDRRRAARDGGIAAHKATFDLIEEARRAEALRRGDLLDVFGDDKVRKEDRWTQEIPEAIVRAQAAEEAHRNELETQAEARHHHTPNRKEASVKPSNVPVPPMLPRQLEKVILNSSPAAVAGAVDDNSVLPAPNHAVLHHLTASAIKSGVIATGCTTRYRKKYITTIYYRAAN